MYLIIITFRQSVTHRII